MKRLAGELRKPLFWLILLCFLGGVFLHYSEFFLASGSSISALFGLERHSIERLLLLAVIVVAGIVHGMGGGIVYLVASALTMLPRLFIDTRFPLDAIYETIAVLVAGAGFNWWFESHRREVGRREQALLELESIRRELQSYIATIRENERRLSVLHSITTAINQLASLSEILTTAADKVMEAVAADGVLIYLIDRPTGELELRQYRGVSAEFAGGVDRLKVGEGFNGWVARSRQPAFIEDSSNDPRLSREVVKREGIGSQYIVPLMAQDEVVGTLCVLSRARKRFAREEEQLLTLIGAELGVALERATLSEEKERAGQRYRELFEKAHDAIWMQDFDGKIVAANQAAADYTGYTLKEVIGTSVASFLAPEALELAREVRRKLLSGIEVEQPYEQRVIRKDGTQAIIMLTTSLIRDERGQPVFQHISRDMTRERQLSENLRLYARQTTRAHEEERKRIARELHDDSIQALSILSRGVDELTGAQAKRSRIVKPLQEIRAEIDSVLARMRLFTQDLRPPTLDYLGLLPAVRELVSQVQQQTGLNIELRIEGEERHFTPEDELLIYRVIQEALRNVWRHAAAAKARVIIKFNTRNAVIEVKDDGKGFDRGEDLRFVKAGKIGLAGMQERADLLGGSLAINSRPGYGTAVTLTVPGERWKTKQENSKP
ncbi:MAG: PAS domain S-box protein [Dehalococcoidia bacterium]|nr:PAS domain S-box protein [Dehalococcoidia bacterium]